MKKAVLFFMTLLLLLNITAGSLAAGSWYCPKCGRLNYEEYCPGDGTKRPASDPASDLSRSRTCPIQPTMYSVERYRDYGSEASYDIKSGVFSAKSVEQNLYRRSFGLYLQMTPSRYDDGYSVSRFDVIVYGPSNQYIWSEGFDTYFTFKYGEYISWGFYNLDDMFNSMLDSQGYFPQGVYTMDIYFNGLYAGKTQFRVRE